MNKTYRVIFSAARGALMVVNELTSSVQKKGASAIVTAAALTLTSTALMAGTTLVADEGQNVDINIEVPDKNGHGVRERQKFCVHGIIGARQSGASNEHEYQTQFS